MSAKIIVFPGCSISVPNATIPVVTIGRNRSVPKHAPYKAPWVLVDESPAGLSKHLTIPRAGLAADVALFKGAHYRLFGPVADHPSKR